MLVGTSGQCAQVGSRCTQRDVLSLSRRVAWLSLFGKKTWRGASARPRPGLLRRKQAPAAVCACALATCSRDRAGSRRFRVDARRPHAPQLERAHAAAAAVAVGIRIDISACTNQDGPAPSREPARTHEQRAYTLLAAKPQSSPPEEANFVRPKSVARCILLVWRSMRSEGDSTPRHGVALRHAFQLAGWPMPPRRGSCACA